MRTEVEILQPHRYSGEMKKPGDANYLIDGETHLRLYKALKWVREAGAPAAAATAARPSRTAPGYGTRHVETAPSAPAPGFTAEPAPLPVVTKTPRGGNRRRADRETEDAPAETKPAETGSNPAESGSTTAASETPTAESGSTTTTDPQ